MPRPSLFVKESLPGSGCINNIGSAVSPAMGRITVFALDDCPFCKKAKELLKSKGVEFDVISLTQVPSWRPLMYLLTNGNLCSKAL